MKTLSNVAMALGGSLLTVLWLVLFWFLWAMTP